MILQSKKDSDLQLRNFSFSVATDELVISHRTRGRGGLTHHLHSEAPAGNRRMAMTFAKLRLIVFLRCIGLDWMRL